MRGPVPLQTVYTPSFAKSSLLIGSIISCCALSAFAQGTVNFANVGVGLNAPISIDGTTKLSTGWTVELLAGPTLNSLRSAATTTFLPTAAGYFGGGTVVISNVPPGATAWCVVQFWATQFGSFTNAYNSHSPNSCGTTAPFQVVLGNFGDPPTPPATLSGLTTTTAYFDTALFDMDLPSNIRVQLSASKMLSFNWNSWHYVVQQTPSLNPPQWVTITNAPELNNAAMRMTLPNPGTNMYYRLVRYF